MSQKVCDCFNLQANMFAILFLVIVFIKEMASAEDSHRLTKRMDLEMCLGQFDVYRNTIIRTEESIAIGGKFLQGIELETLEECQRLCCESDGCDVYVFEEKSEGYCYLFECGPPDNFHCKFTRHSNYTSAVLTPARHLPSPTTPRPLPHTTVMNISQQERELTSLKLKLASAGNQKGRTTTTTTTTTAAPVIIPIGGGAGLQTPTAKSVSANASTVCGRFEFPCHSGECIAVYNACDGIPQCEDGSDEGPECPGAAPVNKLPNNALPEPKIAQPVQPQYQPINPPPVINNREDPMSAPSVWPQNRKVQTIAAPIEVDRSRIFNHKGGIQIASNTISQYPNPNPIYNNQIQRGMYVPPDVQNAYRSPIIQPQDHMVLPPNLNWPQAPQPMLQDNSYILNANGQAIPQPIVPVIQSNSVQQPADGLPPKLPAAVVPNMDADGKGKEDERHSSNDSDEYDDEASTDSPKKKHRKHKNDKSEDRKKPSKKGEYDIHANHDAPVHEQYKMINERLEMEFRDHDGQSDRPGGAVLSLTLGLIVMAALGILITCRMRVAGRPRRSGKVPYAHDPDFLVNGMYL